MNAVANSWSANDSAARLGAVLAEPRHAGSKESDLEVMEKVGADSNSELPALAEHVGAIIKFEGNFLSDTFDKTGSLSNLKEL